MTPWRLVALITLAVAISGCGLAHHPVPPGQAKRIAAPPPGQAKKLVLPPPAWGGRMHWI